MLSGLLSAVTKPWLDCAEDSSPVFSVLMGNSELRVVTAEGSAAGIVAAGVLAAGPKSIPSIVSQFGLYPFLRVFLDLVFCLVISALAVVFAASGVSALGFATSSLGIWLAVLTVVLRLFLSFGLARRPTLTVSPGKI